MISSSVKRSRTKWSPVEAASFSCLPLRMTLVLGRPFLFCRLSGISSRLVERFQPLLISLCFDGI